MAAPHAFSALFPSCSDVLLRRLLLRCIEQAGKFRFVWNLEPADTGEIEVHLYALAVVDLYRAVNLDPLDQGIDQRGRERFVVGTVPDRLQQETEIPTLRSRFR